MASELLRLHCVGEDGCHAEKLVCDTVVLPSFHRYARGAKRVLKQLSVITQWINLRVNDRHGRQVVQVGGYQIDSGILQIG